ncbi:LytTR family DNA-binding domain-containing protein [Paenibacillus sp. S150]|uniref:LytTR family DNA-binding domain-containing protein n=1 Tax=Paenibacillus sp. S150 TaxID=2749826 RepID=UPI001C56EF8C|nr:LytTR family DNA-binding domain-containing protein [Paenibacillus sp. S150]MBW4083563.1 LytTR family transcriptional regulator [Paenibacillus sp. S150]
MDHIVVTNDIHATGGLILVKVDEILYFKSRMEKMHIKIVTSTADFDAMGSIKYWIDMMNNSGHRFKLIDRGTVVNVSKIAGINEREKTLMFAGRNTGNECTIAFHRYRQVRDELLELNNRICVI